MSERPWLKDAACRGMDLALFFPGRGDTTTFNEAVKVCQGCPVREQCLDDGLDELWGVRGGMSENQRKALRRVRNRRREPRWYPPDEPRVATRADVDRLWNMERKRNYRRRNGAA